MAENVKYSFVSNQEKNGNDAIKIIRKIITKFSIKEHIYTLGELTHNEKEKVEE